MATISSRPGCFLVTNHPLDLIKSVKMAQRGCVNSADKFCYVCGEFVTNKSFNKITQVIKDKYREHFGIGISHQDKSWAPHGVCGTCYRYLYQTASQNVYPFGFVQPMHWMEPKDHETDCYFCMTDITGFTTKSKHRIVYPNLTTTTRPIRIDDYPEEPAIPSNNFDGENQRVFEKILRRREPPIPMELDSQTVFTFETDLQSPLGTITSGSEFLAHGPQFTQAELDNLVRNLNLSKLAAEYLGSVLNQKGLLASDTTFSYRNREEPYCQFFKKEGQLVYCTNIPELMHKFKITYNPEDWRLFIDSSKVSLKVVLLHNGNRYKPIPIGHSVHLKEKYENLELILSKIKYNEHKWVVVGDLKITSMILGQQGGYTKTPCFLCEFDTREKDRNDHWVKSYPKRASLVVGKHNVIRPPLVSTDKIILPPLHIKLGIMKQFVKALPPAGNTFLYLRGVFPGLSEAKVKEGVFTGPDIRKLTKNREFELIMTEDERNAWLSFKDVMENFLGNNKSPNYKTIVQNLLTNLRKLNINMSYKIHFLHAICRKSGGI